MFTYDYSSISEEIYISKVLYRGLLGRPSKASKSVWYNQCMCGVFGISVHSLDDRYMSKWNITKYMDRSLWRDRYNIRPTQESPVIAQEESGNTLELMKFGLIPAWSKFDKLEFSTINARAETVDQLATYRKPFKEHRCIVLADGFFEFEKTKEGSQPYYFKVRNHEGPIALAGVYDINEIASDKPIKSFSIITSPANDLVGKVHPRMPVILDLEESLEWLDVDSDPDKLKKLLKPYPDSKMESWRVSKLVNNFRNEGQDLIQPQSS